MARRTSVVMLAVLGIAWFMALGVTEPAYAAGLRAGDVRIVEHPQSDRAMSGGGSNTLFSLKLPDAAACPGDSADGGYRIQGFMVPTTNDPASLRYNSVKPEVEHGWGLYDELTASYANILTARGEEPGGPGRINELPRFTLSVFSPGMVKPGRYRIGIACTLHNETMTYWDGELLIERDASDKPAEIHWSVVGVEDNTTASEDRSAAIVIAAIALFALGIGLLTTRIRARRAPPASSHPGDEPQGDGHGGSRL